MPYFNGVFRATCHKKARSWWQLIIKENNKEKNPEKSNYHIIATLCDIKFSREAVLPPCSNIALGKSF